MRTIITEDFLLDTITARRLYHEHAERMPIIDYHCHIPPMDIAKDVHYENITQLWLGGDHYKWRLIRANGVEEDKITGEADDYTKFKEFATMLPKAIGNPLYHWTHLELKRYFGYEGVLGPETAEEVWELCNERLKTMGVRDMIRMARVDWLATTDDPIDDLEAHRLIAEDTSFETRVVPAWRPDKAVNIDKEGFASYMEKLGEVSGISVRTFSDLQRALTKRLDFFLERGCLASDHGLDRVPYREASEEEVEAIFQKGLSGERPDREETEAYQFAILHFLGKEYYKRGLVMQLHFGAVRNTNTAKFGRLGPDTGFDCIGNSGDSVAITRFLNSLEEGNQLPRTILYSLNGLDNNMLVSIAGCFQGPEGPGKIQHGSGWWFNDTLEGMTAQMRTLAEGGLLGNFIGMLTDSRSFLSYTRHEYFRRILCRILGHWVEDGMYPADMEGLGRMVEDISYYNTDRYFKRG